MISMLQIVMQFEWMVFALSYALVYQVCTPMWSVCTSLLQLGKFIPLHVQLRATVLWQENIGIVAWEMHSPFLQTSALLSERNAKNDKRGISQGASNFLNKHCPTLYLTTKKIPGYVDGQMKNLIICKITCTVYSFYHFRSVQR